MSNLPATLPFNGEVEFREVNGEFALTTEQLAIGLGYADDAHIRKIIERHQDEIEPYRFSDKTSLNPAGGRPAYLYTEEGIYLICMFARTPKAAAFRRQVAAVLAELRQKRVRELEAKLAQLETGLTLTGAGAGDTATALVRRETMEAALRCVSLAWPVHRLKDLAKYRNMGLNQRETGLLLGCGKDAVRQKEIQLRKAGLWEVL